MVDTIPFIVTVIVSLDRVLSISESTEKKAGNTMKNKVWIRRVIAHDDEVPVGLNDKSLDLSECIFWEKDFFL